MTALINASTSSGVVVTSDTSGSLAFQSNGTTIATISSTGLTQNVNSAPAFSVYLGSNQTIANNTDTIVPFDTKEFDTASCFNTSTYRFVPNIAGYYQLNWGTNLYTAGAGEVYCVLLKNGSIYKIAVDINANAVWNICGSCLVYANGTTDYYQIRVYQNTGASRTLYGTNTWSTWFNGSMVRGA